MKHAWGILTILLASLAIPTLADDSAPMPDELFKGYQKDVADVAQEYAATRSAYNAVVVEYARAQRNRVRCSKRFWGGEFNDAFKDLEGARQGLEAQNTAIRKAFSDATTVLRKGESKRSLLELKYKGKVRNESYWTDLLAIRDDGEENYILVMREQIIPAQKDYIAAFDEFAQVYNGLTSDCSRFIPNRELVKTFNLARDSVISKTKGISDILSAVPSASMSSSSASSEATSSAASSEATSTSYQ